MIKETIEKAQLECNAGNFWRAKEILMSSLHTYGYKLELYSFYGSVLLSMHDKIQAGKYFFLSKADPSKEEQEAIELYLERYAKKGYTGILESIPKKSKRQKLSDYPEFVQKRFTMLGAKENLYTFKEKLNEKNGLFATLGCFTILLIIFSCFIIGVATIIRWLFF